MPRSHTYKLPLEFDAQRLRDDLAKVRAGQWVEHFASIHSSGGWSGVALRAIDGSVAGLHSGRADKYADTELLQNCAGFREVLQSFQCPLRRVRLLKLAAGASVSEHVDYGTGYNQNEIRIHVPVITHKDVEFISNGVPVTMHAGETWYLDTTYPHQLSNRSPVDRVHLVIDCQVNDWIKSMLPEAVFAPDIWRILAQRSRFIRYSLVDVLRASRASSEELGMRKKLFLRQLGFHRLGKVTRTFQLRLRSVRSRS